VPGHAAAGRRRATVGQDHARQGDSRTFWIALALSALLYATRWDSAASRWKADSGAVFLLDANGRRPEGWTSADAAGLAILPGLVRYDEVFGQDPIRHAFRFTVQATNGHIYPASHTAGSTPGALPMGARLRLKASKNIGSHPAAVQKIFQAMKTYAAESR
jgi:hypothetical protein